MKKVEVQNNGEIIRGFIITSFSALLLWQIYQLVFFHMYTQVMVEALSNLGFELPVITKLYLSIYKWNSVLPVLTLVLAVDVIRRAGVPKTYAIIGFASAALLTLLFQMLHQQALFTPFFQVLEKIG
ncbi:MAG: hypothetical protein GY765_08400 [bacterium]|nr:hypothetical protein [bacterium]